jgi:hypothetical protein
MRKFRPKAQGIVVSGVDSVSESRRAFPRAAGRARERECMPASARTTVVAAPMLELAPVTTIVRPLRSPMA